MEKVKTTSHQKNILFVDSDKGLINDLKDYLEEQGIKEKFGLDFVFVNNCKEALKKFAEQKVDLVISEIVLPVINGYYLLKAVKKDPQKIPVIFYTRLKGDEDLAKMAASGVDNIFLKPLVKIEELIQKVVNLKDFKEDLDKVVKELQNQIKSLSGGETQSNLKVVQCPRCHLLLSHDSHFCNNCGQKIFRAVKALESKPTEAKAAESKPAETKSAEAKTAEPSSAKATEAPAETKATEAKVAEAKAVETKTKEKTATLSK